MIMTLKHHIIIQIPIFVLFGFYLNWVNASIISLAHFVPSIDYALMKIGLPPQLHRKLLHNIFIALIIFGIIWYFKGLLLGALAFFNIIFHFILDKGQISVFYPLSHFQFRQPK